MIIYYRFSGEFSVQAAYVLKYYNTYVFLFIFDFYFLYFLIPTRNLRCTRFDKTLGFG